ncbi:MAG TPA: gfo/Idh/MocA family oxidoreductase [Candidatus Poseidoniales archaeon]|nr:MAG TPA: gfo/Idh/MocA family oxidoreductase [Candidatus Poseidoniales archaeon]
MGIVIGLVGCGRWGSNHLRVMKRLQNEGLVQRVVVCDVDGERLANIQADATYANLESMLSAEALAAVAIATPPETHLGLAKMVLDRNLPLLLEKPLSNNHAASKTFLAELPNDSILVVGYLLRHHEGLLQTQTAAFAKAVGNIRDVVYTRRTRRMRPDGATPISTLAVHAADTLAWLLAQPLMQGETVHAAHSENAASWRIRFPTGQTGAFDVAWATSDERRLVEIEGTRGRARIDFGSHEMTVIDSSGVVVRTERLADSEPLLAEWLHFLDSIKAGSPCVFPDIDRLLDQSEWLEINDPENGR